MRLGALNSNQYPCENSQYPVKSLQVKGFGKPEGPKLTIRPLTYKRFILFKTFLMKVCKKKQYKGYRVALSRCPEKG